ncbi:MAG TPA: XRE family transcriptional regulator [Thermodesulfobacteriota bacterium]|nr:XRE family transcriptional regulator [Thermodesulfobacteriota bacterium]
MKTAKGTRPSREKRKTGDAALHDHGDFLTHPSHFKARENPAPPAEKETLGGRIRRAREMRGLALQDLMSRTGIALDTLEKLESNERIPPLGELIRLGKALEMKMGYFISPGAEKPMAVVHSDKRRAVSRHGKKKSEQYGYSYESLAPEKADRFMEPFLITMVPTNVKELSTHDGQEFIFVLEGEIRAQVMDQVEVLRPGDAVYYDSQHPHLVKCHGDKPAKILAVLYTGSK